MDVASVAIGRIESELNDQIADLYKLNPDCLLSFYDLTDFVTQLLSTWNRNDNNLHVYGQCTPDLAIAADRAELKLNEHLGLSPFSAEIDSGLESLSAPTDLIYLSNPNRVTGTTYSRDEIEMLANANPDGLLIVDEHFVDFYGISTIGLTEKYDHVVVLRSFSTAFGINSLQSGFVVGSRSAISKMEETVGQLRLSSTARRLITTVLTSDDAVRERLQLVHDESLRLATSLNRLGIQNRITPTDFLLFRVADPVKVGNALAASKVNVENLDGYPQMKQYLRYFIQSPLSNDQFVRAMQRMPKEYYYLPTLDKRVSTLRRQSERLTSDNTVTSRLNDILAKEEI